LQHEHILAAHVLKELHHHFAVRKTANFGATEMYLEALRDSRGELRIGISGEHHQAVK